MRPRPLPEQSSDALIADSANGTDRLLEIMRRLREPVHGCPWDLKQDFSTIAPYTIEEAYEVADAIERSDMDDLRDELGDLLLQVAYHAQMAEEAGDFSYDDVVEAICAKMLRRHPHVFGDDKSQRPDWEAVKAAERADKGRPRESALDGVPLGLPALTRAVKLQDRAARVGFDWPDASHVLDKIVEEAQELVEARDTLSKDAQEEEFGDLLFVIANLARHLKIDPEHAVSKANTKFQRRFSAVEAKLRAIGKEPQESTLAEMDAFWDAAKQDERS